MSQAKKRQTPHDRRHILQNLPAGTRRVQVVEESGKKTYKRPEDVDSAKDEIVMSTKGLPVVMRGKPGRKPKNGTLQPLTTQIGEVATARDEHMEANSLVQTIRIDAGSESALDAVVVGLAEEAANVEFERIEAQRHGRDSTNISTKRARILKSMADVVIKRQLLNSGGVIDMDGIPFESLFLFIMETFKGAMKDAGIRGEEVEQTFTALVSTLRDSKWKEEAKTRMKEKMRGTK